MELMVELINLLTAGLGLAAIGVTIKKNAPVYITGMFRS